jgi:hypothetical protein
LGERVTDIGDDKLEVVASQEMLDVFPPPCEQVIKTNNAFAFGYEPITQVAAEKAGSSRHECATARKLLTHESLQFNRRDALSAIQTAR